MEQKNLKVKGKGRHIYILYIDVYCILYIRLYKKMKRWDFDPWFFAAQCVLRRTVAKQNANSSIAQLPGLQVQQRKMLLETQRLDRPLSTEYGTYQPGLGRLDGRSGVADPLLNARASKEVRVDVLLVRCPAMPRTPSCIWKCCCLQRSLFVMLVGLL